MKPTNKVLMKDIIYNLQAYLYWRDVYNAEEEWSMLKNVVDFEQRLRDLLPKALAMLKTDDFDYRCG